MLTVRLDAGKVHPSNYIKSLEPNHTRFVCRSSEGYRLIGMNFQPSESFSLINDPRNEYSKLYTVDKLGNIWGGRPVLCKYSEQ